MIAAYRGRNLFKTSGRCAISAKKLGILLNFCVRASNVAPAAGAALSFVSGLTAAMKPPRAKGCFPGVAEGVYTRFARANDRLFRKQRRQMFNRTAETFALLMF